MLKKLLQLLQKGSGFIFEIGFLKKLKGYKTLALSVVTMLIGALVFFQDQLHGEVGQAFCNVGITLFCDFTGSKFYGSLIVAIGFLNKLLRLITDTPIPVLDKPVSNGQVKK